MIKSLNISLFIIAFIVLAKAGNMYEGEDNYNKVKYGGKINIWMPIMESMMQDMNWVKYGYGDIDLDFCAMMTPHHWGAIFMCEEHLKHGKSAEIKSICEDIIWDQISQVIKFKNYFEKRGVVYDDPSLEPHFPILNKGDY